LWQKVVLLLLIYNEMVSVVRTNSCYDLLAVVYKN